MLEFVLLEIWFCSFWVLNEVSCFFSDNLTTYTEETNITSYPEVAVNLLQPKGFVLFLKGEKLLNVEYHINLQKPFKKIFPGEINGFDTYLASETWVYENHDILLNDTNYLHWYFIAQPIHSSPYQAEYFYLVSKLSNGTLYFCERVARQGNLVVGRWYKRFRVYKYEI